jgi:hypothetical protein
MQETETFSEFSRSRKSEDFQNPENQRFSRKEKDFARDFLEKIAESMRQVHQMPVEIKSSLTQVAPLRLMPQQPIITKITLPEPSTQIFYSKLQGISFGKITALVLDPKIKSIICNGANQPLKIKKTLSPLPTETNILLSEDEIKQVIRTFSEKGGAPMANIFRARIENIGIEAIVSDIMGSRFIITK